MAATVKIKGDEIIIEQDGGQSMTLPKEAEKYLPENVARFPDVAQPDAEPAAPVADYSQSLPQPLSTNQPNDPRQPLPLMDFAQQKLPSLFQDAGAPPPSLAGGQAMASNAPPSGIGKAFASQPLPNSGQAADFSLAEALGMGRPAPKAPVTAKGPFGGVGAFGEKWQAPVAAPSSVAALGTPVAVSDELGRGPGVAGAKPTGFVGSAPTAPSSGYAGLLRDEALSPIPASYSPPQAERDIKKQFALTEGKGPSPETQAAVMGAYDTRAGHELAGAAELQKAQAMAGLTNLKAAEAADAEISRIRSEQAAKQAQVASLMTDLDRRIDGVKTLSAESPVDRYWSRKGTFGTIVTQIGNAIAQAGAAVLRIDNPVAKQIQDGINAEVDHQKLMTDSAHASLRERFSLLAELRASMMSPEAAEKAFQMTARLSARLRQTHPLL